jgi:Flagellar hook-length control protein FliK
LIDATLLAKTLEALAKLVRAPLLELPEKTGAAVKWAPGQQVDAKVERLITSPKSQNTPAPLRNETAQPQKSTAEPQTRALVRIAGQVYDMRLPRLAQKGETLKLVYVGERARPTFLLAQQTPPGKPGQVALSDTAKVLGQLLAQAGNQPARAPVSAAAPLLNAPPAKTADLAQALGKALVQSGLFYESHQAEWVSGKRPLETLLQEPQARLPQSQSPATLADEKVPDTQAAASTPARPAQGAAILIRNPTQLVLPRVQESVAPAAGQSVSQPAAKEGPPINPDSLPLVRQQLDVMDMRQIVWQGEVWPGQSMRWRVEAPPEREAGADGEAQEAAAGWHTRLELALPNLGDILADVWLTPKGMWLSFSANDAARDAMRAEAESLSSRMRTAGLNLTGIQWANEAQT